MYRDSELEARRQIVNYLQEFSRLMVEISGLLVKMIDMIMEGETGDLDIVYENIKEVDEKAYDLEKTIINEILRLRPFLPNSEAIYTLVAEISDIVDSIDGAGYRIANLGVDQLPPKYLDVLKDIASALYDEIDAFREAIYLLGYNPAELRNAVERVYKLENMVDSVYRGGLSKVFREEKKPLNLIKWLEVAERLENAADNVERAADILITFLLT